MEIIPRDRLFAFHLLVSVSLSASGTRAARASDDSPTAGEWTGHAVLVGVPYCPGSTEHLEYADNDARDLCAALMLDADHWGAERITILCGNAGTAEAIRSAVRAMGAAAAPGDVCVFSYAGHGGQAPDEFPLDEADGLDEYLSTCTDWICDDEIAEWFAAFECRNVCLIIDSCKAGGVSRSVSPVDEPPEDFALGIAEDLSRSSAFAYEARAVDGGSERGPVLLAASPEAGNGRTSVALENGIFTFFVVEALWQPRTDADGDGNISAEEVFAYAAPRTTEYSLWQTPVLLDLHADELPLARAPARDFGALEDTAFGGGACDASSPANRHGRAWGLVIALALLLAGVAFIARPARAAAVPLVAFALSAGCAASTVADPSTSVAGERGAAAAPRTPREEGTRRPPFVRVELAWPIGERQADYGPGLGAGVFVGLGGGARRWELGVDALFLKSREVDMTETLLSAGCDVLWRARSASATRESYILTGARGFLGTSSARWGGVREVAAGARFGFGRRGIASPHDLRVTLDALLGSENIRGIVGLTVAFGF